MFANASPRRTFALALVLAGFAGQAPARAADALGFPFGLWRNPKDTVHIEIRPCGAAACGYVVWANAKAQADARRGGTDPLVGLQLFKDFTPLGKDVWRGKVFVPDLRMTLTGTAAPAEGPGLKARGCLIGNYFCKTQVWRRAVEPSD
jgi:uncharacterized protein (DUF2147 family)